MYLQLPCNIRQQCYHIMEEEKGEGEEGEEEEEEEEEEQED